MGPIKSYFSRQGWKKDLERTITDFQDLSILIKRALGLSHYGFKSGGEMTSRETEDFLFHLNALCFNNEHDFQVYALTHKYPLGSCVIGFGKGAKKYDDTFLPEKFYN